MLLVLFKNQLKINFCGFPNSPCLALDTVNVISFYVPISKILSVERKVNMTAPVKNWAKYGHFGILG